MASSCARRLRLVAVTALAALLLSAAPAVGAPPSPILRARFKGWLGPSGIHVETTPQSVLVTYVAKGSPAWRASITGQLGKAGASSDANQVVRLLMVNGQPVSTLSTAQLRKAFQASQVVLIMGRRGPADLEETRVGPLVVELAQAATTRALDLAGQGLWARALTAAKDDPASSEAVVSRMLFEAQRLAAEGDPGRARRLLALVPREATGHERAAELSRQYEKVTQEARRAR